MIGSPGSSYKLLFLVTFLSSLITASLGMAKVLKVIKPAVFKVLISISKMGVCKVVAEGGLLCGFLSIRFVIIFFACLCTLITKCLTMCRSSSYVFTALALFYLILPGLIIGLVSTWHRNLFKTFIKHPSILLLPMFSFFTFESNVKKFCQKKDNLADEVEIRFSVKATFFNILLTVISLIVLDFIGPQDDSCFQSVLDCSFFLLFSLLPGILFTTIFLYWCSPTTARTLPHLSASSRAPSTPPARAPSTLEFSVFKPSSPDKVFVIDQQSKEVTEVEELAREEVQADSGERGDIEMMGMQENRV